ncbi:MAG: T9SS type A sorting domain-containing protein [Taibaiella sp.]|nr:T9SS type A sorting domain-containing protein [Taibaiella sp.]
MKYLPRSKNPELHRALLALVFSLSILRAYAQNYKCFQPGAIHYFSNSEGYLRGIRIDSVRTIGSDTVYYPFHTVRGYYCEELDCDGGSWLGKKVIEQPNGDFLFDNIWQDTVLIKTRATLGDSWVFYDDTGDISYVATVINLDTATIYGTVDSIKVLTIAAYDHGLPNPSDPVNNFQIKISRNYGFLQVFDLMTFPYHYPGSLSGVLSAFDYYFDFATRSGGSCSSMSTLHANPTTNNSIFRLSSFPNPTMMEIYATEAGDEFEYYTNGSTAYSSSSFSYWTELTWDSVISTIATPYTQSYLAKTKSRKTTTSATGTTVMTNKGDLTFSNDTSRVFLLEKMPEEKGQRYGYYYKPSSNPTDLCKPDSFVRWEYEMKFDSPCFVLWQSIDGENYGLGVSWEAFAIGQRKIAHTYGSYGYSGLSEYGKNFYFKKHGIECGLYQPVQTKDFKKDIEREISIFPNPVHNELNISAPFEITDIMVTNTVGSVVHQSTHNSRDVQLQLADLPPSIYFVRLNGNLMYKISKQ